jgi:hypothetical protein
VRWLQLHIKSRDFAAVVSTLLRARACFQMRLNLGGMDWGPMRIVSETQKCHLWFPCVLHALLPLDFLDAALPVDSASAHVSMCEAVVQAAHLVQDALDSNWSLEDADILMKELLGCTKYLFFHRFQIEVDLYFFRIISLDQWRSVRPFQFWDGLAASASRINPWTVSLQFKLITSTASLRSKISRSRCLLFPPGSHLLIVPRRP